MCPSPSSFSMWFVDLWGVLEEPVVGDCVDGQEPSIGQLGQYFSDVETAALKDFYKFFRARAKTLLETDPKTLLGTDSCKEVMNKASATLDVLRESG